MSPLNLAERLGQDEFLAGVLHRTWHHVPGALKDPASLMSWNALNGILAAHRLDPPRLRLSVNGEVVPQYRYASPVTTRRHVVWQRLHPAELAARLGEGASLVLDAADELYPPVGQAAAELEQWLRTGVQANLYASWTATEGFGCHWDDHDVLVIQVEGAKRWKLYRPTRTAPMYKDTEQPGPPVGDPDAEFILRPGDILYLPRGWWHSVTTEGTDPSLHLTFGIQTVTGAMLLGWLADEIRCREALRLDLPAHAASGVQEAYLENLRAEVAAALADPQLITRYVASRDASDVTRMRPSLPFIRGVPADPAVRIGLATSRARLEASGDTVLFRACDTEWELSRRTAPMLEMLISSAPGQLRLGDLAEAAGLSLEQAAMVASDLLAGQALAAEAP